MYMYQEVKTIKYFMRHIFPGHRPNPCLATGLNAIHLKNTVTWKSKFGSIFLFENKLTVVKGSR